MYERYKVTESSKGETTGLGEGSSEKVSQTPRRSCQTGKTPTERAGKGPQGQTKDRDICPEQNNDRPRKQEIQGIL